MKWMLGTVATAALMLGGTSVATAQDGFFQAPVFVAQPGVVRSFSEGASTEFNARFVTAIPLSTRSNDFSGNHSMDTVRR